MEHLEELLIDTTNASIQQQLFGMLFEELPTYDEIIDGHPKPRWPNYWGDDVPGYHRKPKFFAG